MLVVQKKTTREAQKKLAFCAQMCYDTTKICPQGAYHAAPGGASSQSGKED
jgi:hypothetical protein